MGYSPGITVKQERLARALAGGAESITEAAGIAGMNRTSASLALKRNATLRSRVEELQDRQADRASRLSAKAAKFLERALDDPECNPLVAVATWKTAEEVKAASPPELDEHTPESARNASLVVLQAAMIGARLCARVGFERASALLGPVVDALQCSGDESEKILALRSVKALLRYAQAE